MTTLNFLQLIILSTSITEILFKVYKYKSKQQMELITTTYKKTNTNFFIPFQNLLISGHNGSPSANYT